MNDNGIRLNGIRNIHDRARSLPGQIPGVSCFNDRHVRLHVKYSLGVFIHGMALGCFSVFVSRRRGKNLDCRELSC